MSGKPKPLRPGGVTALGVLAVLIGLLGIVGGAITLTSSDIVTLALSAFAVVVGILYLVTGIGFFRGNGWAWILGLGVSILSLARNIAEATEGGIVYAIPGIVVALIIIYYLNTPAVRAFFGKATMPAKSG